MQISRHILRESLLWSAVAFGLSLIMAPVIADQAAHPGWLVVLALAARYGTPGLCAATVFAAAATALAALCTGPGLAALAEPAGSDLGAAIAGVMVAWIADSQLWRTGVMASQVAALAERARDAEESVARLTEAALVLRAQVDRTEHSLAFLHDIAVRMEGTPRDSAEAALDLALARTGARAGVVQIASDDRCRTLASRGAWNLDELMPPPGQRDRTACAALKRRRAVHAGEVAGVRASDSDIAAPILSRDGHALGIIALRGVPLSTLCAASLSDLNIVVSWLAHALSTRTTEAIDAAAGDPVDRLADAG